MRQPTQSEWPAIWQLFDQLIEMAPHARDARLDRGDIDPFVAEQVRSLLRSGESAGLLDGAPDSARDGPQTEYASLTSGTVVGGFRVVKLIGRGGMGEVYLAERIGAGFDQRAALKMLRPEAVARAGMFEAERKLLATLEHPGIARLIDGGIADDGRAYMAMEYVEGEDIGAWCARHHASLDDRLRLFLELCEALSYAHAHLVVHRDIKRANIMIDQDGRVRLLDFGIAQLIDDAAGGTMTLALLTPDYAAPEQLRNARPTVATDIYALGAVLYEMLTGTGPWRADARSVSSIVRRALHDDPAPPSRRAREQEQSPVPAHRIAGDLDAIILKAMRHVPEARYASVADLAEDIRRYQDVRPVRAHAGTNGYRLRRFVQRNSWSVALGGGLALALVAGTAGVAWQARKAAVERDIARSELRRSEAGLNAMTFLFRNASDSGEIGSVTARDMLNRSARNLIVTMRPTSPDTVDAVLTLADLYLVTEDSAGAEAFLRRAIDAGVGSNDPVATARMRQRMGQILASMNRTDEARAMLDAADRVFRADPARFRTERQDMIGARAYMLRVAGDREGGVRLLENSLPEAEIAYADNPRELLTRYGNLSVHYIEAGRLEKAAALLDRGEQLARRTESMATVPGLMIQVHQGTLQLRRGDLAAAYERYSGVAKLRRELYGPSAGLGFDLVQTSTAQLMLGRPSDALKSLDEAIPMLNNFLGPTAPPAIHGRINRVEALAGLGRLAEAAAALTGIEGDLAAAGSRAAANPNFLRARATLRIAQRRFTDARTDIAAADKLLAAAGAGGAYARQRLAAMRARLP